MQPIEMPCFIGHRNAFWREENVSQSHILEIEISLGDFETWTLTPDNSDYWTSGRDSDSVSSWFGMFWSACALGMAQVGTLFLLLWRDCGGGFTGQHRIAAHRILESGR